MQVARPASRTGAILWGIIGRVWLRRSAIGLLVLASAAGGFIVGHVSSPSSTTSASAARPTTSTSSPTTTASETPDPVRAVLKEFDNDPLVLAAEFVRLRTELARGVTLSPPVVMREPPPWPPGGPPPISGRWGSEARGSG